MRSLFIYHRTAHVHWLYGGTRGHLETAVRLSLGSLKPLHSSYSWGWEHWRNQ